MGGLCVASCALVGERQMTIVLSCATGVLAVLVGCLAWLYLRASKALIRFQAIVDVEQYAANCQEQANSALADRDKLANESDLLRSKIEKYQGRVAKYMKLLGNLETAAQLQQRIKSDKARAESLRATIVNLEHASQLDAYLQEQKAEIAKQKRELAKFSNVLGTAKTAAEIAAQVRYYENYLGQIKADIEAVEEAGEMQEFGFYRTRYDLESVDAYKNRLDSIKERQKGMLKRKSACTCETEWTVEGSKREGQKMVDQQIKLMLRAYNGECDAAIGKARYNNVTALEKRIEKAFDQINKLGETKRVVLSREYCELRISELHLSYEYEQMKQEEKERQREIREQMREEQKATKEIEKARESAEKDEKLKMDALEKARAELDKTAGQQTEKLASLVKKLETELQEALDRKAKAIARAQLTRSGHVYVLSNIGSFGEGVYKIGMTRRLEPLERVSELGSASVPFFFDVHAMLYSEDAPALERKLHEHFQSRRVNLVNQRKEFFRVSLDEIRAAVAKHFGQVTFVTVPAAEQYRETLAMQKEQVKESALQIA